MENKREQFKYHFNSQKIRAQSIVDQAKEDTGAKAHKKKKLYVENGQ